MVREGELTSVICGMISKKSVLTNPVAKEASKYLSNITQNDPSPFPPIDATRFYDENVHEAVLTILKSLNPHYQSKSIAVRALQNIVSHPQNALRLVHICLEPILKFLKEQHDQGAAQVLFNFSCIPECREELVESQIHLKVLEFMMTVKDIALKSVFLQILVQLSSLQVCVLELLKMEVILKLEMQLKIFQNQQVLRDISLMLLAIVAYANQKLNEQDSLKILNILKVIVKPGTEEDILENCANVLKFISSNYHDFEQMNEIIQNVLELGNNEEIVDCISNVLYNLTLYQSNMDLMLNDTSYLNVMIKMLRNGNVVIQENIAHAMRTLCSVDKCARLLLKNDILSDLIVIALLRTSSEEIKRVCSEAFYNMLCHEKTRLELLQGDCW